MRIVKRWGQISGFDSEKYIYQDETNGPVKKKKMTSQTQETWIILPSLNQENGKQWHQLQLTKIQKVRSRRGW